MRTTRRRCWSGCTPTGVRLQVLRARTRPATFLAVRRWYGWSAGQLLVLDIGGGSLELAAGRDEDPEVALSLPLGAGRLTRERLSGDPPERAQIDALAEDLDAAMALAARQVRKLGQFDLVAGTSKTFRSLARLAGAASSSAGLRARRTLTDVGLRQFGFISRIPSADLAELEGVGAGRAHQLVAGASVATAAMRTLRISELICPWALREGVILRRLDTSPVEYVTEAVAAQRSPDRAPTPARSAVHDPRHRAAGPDVLRHRRNRRFSSKCGCPGRITASSRRRRTAGCMASSSTSARWYQAASEVSRLSGRRFWARDSCGAAWKHTAICCSAPSSR